MPFFSECGAVRKTFVMGIQSVRARECRYPSFGICAFEGSSIPQTTTGYVCAGDGLAVFYMDFLEGAGNDVDLIERSRHSATVRNSKAGGSVYTFADGSSRYIKYRGVLYPLNLWSVTDSYRTNRAMSN